MKITFYGHACFGIEIGGKHLIVDPFISPNPMAKDVDVNAIKADYILLTHGHQDHVVDVEPIGQRTGATVISSFEVASYYGSKGLKMHPLNHGGKWTFDFGTLKYVNAVHSSVMPDGTYGGNPGGFVLWNEEKCLYIAGDTALTMDMKLIPMTCPKLTAAILPIGDNFTMGYEDALIASDFIECNKIIGCHFDTFDPIKIDREVVEKAFAEKGKDLTLPEIGTTYEI